MPQRNTEALTCRRCRAPFRTTKQARQRGAMFCSRDCAAKATATKRARRGVANASYNGGLSQRRDGRWSIMCRDGSSYLYSRAVLAAERGRELTADEVAHHRNHDRSDDRVENLSAMTRSEHARMHALERWAARRAI